MAIEFSSTDIYAVGVTGNANAHKLCLPKLSSFSFYGKNEKYALHVSTPDDHAPYFELVLVILVNDYFSQNLLQQLLKIVPYKSIQDINLQSRPPNWFDSHSIYNGMELIDSFLPSVPDDHDDHDTMVCPSRSIDQVLTPSNPPGDASELLFSYPFCFNKSRFNLCIDEKTIDPSWSLLKFHTKKPGISGSDLPEFDRQLHRNKVTVLPADLIQLLPPTGWMSTNLLDLYMRALEINCNGKVISVSSSFYEQLLQHTPKFCYDSLEKELDLRNDLSNAVLILIPFRCGPNHPWQLLVTTNIAVIEQKVTKLREYGSVQDEHDRCLSQIESYKSNSGQQLIRHLIFGQCSDHSKIKIKIWPLIEKWNSVLIQYCNREALSCQPTLPSVLNDIVSVSMMEVPTPTQYRPCESGAYICLVANALISWAHGNNFSIKRSFVTESKSEQENLRRHGRRGRRGGRGLGFVYFESSITDESFNNHRLFQDDKTRHFCKQFRIDLIHLVILISKISAIIPSSLMVPLICKDDKWFPIAVFHQVAADKAETSSGPDSFVHLSFGFAHRKSGFMSRKFPVSWSGRVHPSALEYSKHANDYDIHRCANLNYHYSSRNIPGFSLSLNIIGFKVCIPDNAGKPQKGTVVSIKIKQQEDEIYDPFSIIANDDWLNKFYFDVLYLDDSDHFEDKPLSTHPLYDFTRFWLLEQLSQKYKPGTRVRLSPSTLPARMGEIVESKFLSDPQSCTLPKLSTDLGGRISVNFSGDTSATLATFNRREIDHMLCLQRAHDERTANDDDDDDDDDDVSQCSLDSYLGPGGFDYEVFHLMDADQSFPTNEDLDHLQTDAHNRYCHHRRRLSALFNSKPMLSRCLKHQRKPPYPLLINDTIRINSTILAGQIMVRVVGLCPDDPQRMVVVNSGSNCANITPTTPDTRISVIRHPPYCSNCVIGTYAFVKSGSESIVDVNSGLMNSINNDRRNKVIDHAKLQKAFEGCPPK